MGAGIAQAFAQSGFQVLMYDLIEGFAAKSRTNIFGRLQKQVEKGKLTQEGFDGIAGCLAVASSLDEAADADVVLEAIIENMEAKTSLFSKLDKICQPNTIFTSNTSSLSITEMGAATSRPNQVIGMHFSNPAPVMKFMEITKGLLCDEKTHKAVYDLSVAIGKDPVTVIEGPGFVFNRIIIPMVNEAIGVYADGISSAEEIDKVIKLGANHPMGPLALADLIGLDVVLAIMETLQREMGNNKYAPHPLLKKMCRGKLLGRKTGRGFYHY